MATALRAQLMERRRDFIAYSLAVDESTDVRDTKQLAIFIRFVTASLTMITDLVHEMESSSLSVCFTLQWAGYILYSSSTSLAQNVIEIDHSIEWIAVPHYFVVNRLLWAQSCVVPHLQPSCLLWPTMHKFYHGSEAAKSQKWRLAL